MPAIIAMLAMLAMLAGCLPGQVHPEPAPLLGVQLIGSGTPVAAIRLCEAQSVISVWVETEDRTQIWEIVDHDNTFRPAELRLLETPEGWQLEEASLTELRPGVTYVTNIVTRSPPDVQSVYFRLSDLQGLELDEVWSYQTDAGPLRARAISTAEFEQRAADACADAES